MKNSDLLAAVVLLMICTLITERVYEQETTPEVTPIEASNITRLEVISTLNIDVAAVPDQTATHLAPNGLHFVYFSGENMCLYEGDMEKKCISFGEKAGEFDPESVRWSPDSRYITFHENFFLHFIDSDIWLWDITTDEFVNLTDDGDNIVAISNELWKNIDVLSTWQTDRRIIFLRYGRVTRENRNPIEIYAIEPDGSQLELLGTIDQLETFWVYALDTFGSQLWYDHFVDRGAPERGVWVSDLDGSDLEQVLQVDDDIFISNLSLSPQGDYALLHTPSGNSWHLAANSDVRLLNVASGEIELIDPDQFVTGAGWSPDGTLLAYLVYNRSAEDKGGLYVTDRPGTPGRMILQGSFPPPMLRQRQPLAWGANNTILISRAPDPGVILVELGT